MYRALIVEDDAEAARTLRAHLVRLGAEKGESFSIEVVTSAVELLEGKHPADIYFLDIGLPGINGMEAAQLIREEDQITPIIFVTDLAQYAVQGYAVDALDFMLKPVSYEDFALRMNRALAVLSRNTSDAMSIPCAGGTRIVRITDIVFIEILHHDLYWHVSGEDEPLRMRGSISAAAKELGPEQFCQISASHLINMSHVARIQASSVLMDDGSELFFTRTKKREAMVALTRYIGGGR